MTTTTTPTDDDAVDPPVRALAALCLSEDPDFDPDPVSQQTRVDALAVVLQRTIEDWLAANPAPCLTDDDGDTR